MVRLLSTLVLAATATLSLAAPGDPPDCAVTCLTLNRLTIGSCATTDTACLCASRTYTSSVQQCMQGLCNRSDLRDGTEYFSALCLEALASASLSTSSSTTLQGTRSNTATTSNTRTTSSSSSIPTTSTTSTSTSTSTSTARVITSATPPVRPASTTRSSSTTASAGITSGNESGNSADQANTQRNAAIGGVIGALALIGIIAIILVVMKRRKEKAAQDEKRFSEYIGQDVGSPSAVPRPWGASVYPTYTHSESEHSWAQNKGYYSGNNAAWQYGGGYQQYDTSSSMGMHEKPLPPIGGYNGYEQPAYGMQPAAGEPRHPAFRRPQQEAVNPADEYHSIGSSFLRNP